MSNIRLTPNNYTRSNSFLQEVFCMFFHIINPNKKHFLNWWAMRDLNLRPRHYQWRALTSWANRPQFRKCFYILNQFLVEYPRLSPSLPHTECNVFFRKSGTSPPALPFTCKKCKHFLLRSLHRTPFCFAKRCSRALMFPPDCNDNELSSQSGGASGTRTPDPLLAKQVL